ncbi:glutaredoxin 3 [Desulfuribacillus alkaliarsenatis]|uniref:Glutaredoxin n=1 Tax=Desulfuribacillus alkaliarsenatis TaxID=766136 RepID=A0A1E5FZ56_9FIRM|nr:glutaredoxin 3 [Desulfuribacillus alkaliarsenatis]OEF95781.1 glutaredoxin 3 [Desulfuribacillus alkaliarsenatis]
MKEVTIYIKSYCPYCKKALALLESKGVELKIVDAMEEPELFEKIKEQTGSRTVPQIFIGDEFVGGCDDVHALDSTGQLDAKLK